MPWPSDQELRREILAYLEVHGPTTATTLQRACGIGYPRTALLLFQLLRRDLISLERTPGGRGKISLGGER